MALKLPMPPQQGMTMEVYSYLFQMAQLLNVAIDSLDRGYAVMVEKKDTSEQPSSSAAMDEQYQNLKSLIVKTADQVQQEMDTLEVQLKGSYVASSEFGTYIEQLSSYIEANPAALTQYYSFASDLKSNTEAVSAAFADYKASTEGYIRTGIVYYDGAVPVYGVAVGQNLTTTEVDGEEVVAQNNFRATYTANKLSFWQDAEEVAYVSNNRLYITNITVLGSITIGAWKLFTDGGLKFQWMGG